MIGINLAVFVAHGSVDPIGRYCMLRSQDPHGSSRRIGSEEISRFVTGSEGLRFEAEDHQQLGGAGLGLTEKLNGSGNTSD